MRQKFRSLPTDARILDGDAAATASPSLSTTRVRDLHEWKPSNLRLGQYNDQRFWWDGWKILEMEPELGEVSRCFARPVLR
jgi:hypothetical protein